MVLNAELRALGEVVKGFRSEGQYITVRPLRRDSDLTMVLLRKRRSRWRF